MRSGHGRIFAAAMLIVPLAVALPQSASAQAGATIRICNADYDVANGDAVARAIRGCLGSNARLVIRQNGAGGAISIQGSFADMPTISIGPPKPKPNRTH